MENEGKMGPKMLALPNERWRSFAIAFVEGGTGNATAALKATGCVGTEVALRVNAHHMRHDIRMQEAIQEEAKKRMVSLLPIALQVHTDVMKDPEHKDRLNAARSVLDRAGLHTVTEEKKSLEVTFNTDQIARARSLAVRLGVPLEKLIGSRLSIPAPVEQIEDAEFEDA